MEQCNSVIVEAVSGDGKRLKVGGDWYGAFNASAVNGAQAGNLVTFHWQKSADGKWRNIKGKVTVMDASNPAVTGSSGGGAPSGGGYRGGRAGNFPIHPLDGQRSICRQNALTNAINFLKGEGDVDKVIEVARLFEAYTTGDIDAEMAKEMLATED